MNVTNQELYELKMPQVIIEDTIATIKLDASNEIMDKETLDSMYRVQSEIFKLFGLCDMREIEANTISPSQQNIFIPLKTWNINLGGCYAEIRIMQRCWDGCFAEMKIL